MANCAIFASGNGSNFQAIAESLEKTDHSICCLVCDNKQAFALERAANLHIPSYVVLYNGRSREETENEIISCLNSCSADLIALAGFMKILTTHFIHRFNGRIINIHPSLLPKHPGTNGIADSFYSDDKELGITIHDIDEGVDTGPIIMQKSFLRHPDDTLEIVEKKIHDLEHASYPEILIKLLDRIEGKGY